VEGGGGGGGGGGDGMVEVDVEVEWREATTVAKQVIFVQTTIYFSKYNTQTVLKNTKKV
jgi:hypothetical protein